MHRAVTLEMMGKFAVTTAFSIMYAYTAEVYPTVLRNTALGTCSMAARIGAIIAPYVIYLRKDGPTSVTRASDWVVSDFCKCKLTVYLKL